MVPHLRAAFNANWTEEKFRDLVRRLETRTGATLGFPISETPCFFPQSLMRRLASTGLELVHQILDNADAMAAAEKAVPDRFKGPGDDRVDRPQLGERDRDAGLEP